MEDWESIEGAPEPEPERAKQVEGSEPGQPCSDKESQGATTSKQIRVQLPSGTSVAIRELCTTVAPTLKHAPPTNVDAAALDSSKLWRVINTSRRWNNTVQMLQNKLREAKRPPHVLRDAFAVAAEDFVLPEQRSKRELTAKISELVAALRGLSDWVWLGPVVQRLETAEKPSDKAQGGGSVNTKALEQAKVALLVAICCVYSPDKGDNGLHTDYKDPAIEAIPAAFKLAVTGNATVPFGSSLLAELIDEQSAGLLTSISVSMDFTAANRTRAALQAGAKQTARERQLYGRSMGTPTTPAPLIVPCTVTLQGSDYPAMQRIGAKAAQTLRAETAKRQRDDSGPSSSNTKRRASAVTDDASSKDRRLAAALADSLLAGR